ncbi:ankyrin repeat domain-containing protein [Orientia tsutsugamushi]|uniref:Ankyrin repeat family protein n=1 Tax=Orientia tsutsugamushi str. TA716 TaxID=1359175 RepID=A0A0F3NUL8_ORITS|nr:ankyrin repeat domain-containing protein [Orientia tsutsugamushi]KJV71461.1 ankyrin repeat family protein [Orientia tsutsugamushi str. TA716]KJV72986.1 ankyrin repeat family protein [Orientia tsutsugamushi str. TA716]
MDKIQEFINYCKTSNEFYFALQLAVLQNDVEAAKLFIHSNADLINTQGPGRQTIPWPGGKTIQLSCRETALHLAVKENKLDCAELLISEGIDLNAKNSFGYTALYNAIICDNVEAVKLLIDANADLINIQLSCRETALHLAVKEGKLDCVKLLIDANADLINIRDPVRGSALHLALKEGKLDYAKLLVSKGANLDIKDCFGDTACDVAIDPNRIDEIRKVLTNDLTKIYQDMQILTYKSQLFASHVNKSKLFNLDTDSLEQVYQHLNADDIYSLKKAITIELCTKLKHDKKSVSPTNTELHTDTELHIDTELPPIGECSINDNA